jgi:hypothetical protein
MPRDEQDYESRTSGDGHGAHQIGTESPGDQALRGGIQNGLTVLRVLVGDARGRGVGGLQRLGDLVGDLRSATSRGDGTRERVGEAGRENRPEERLHDGTAEVALQIRCRGSHPDTAHRRRIRQGPGRGSHRQCRTASDEKEACSDQPIRGVLTPQQRSEKSGEYERIAGQHRRTRAPGRDHSRRPGRHQQERGSSGDDRQARFDGVVTKDVLQELLADEHRAHQRAEHDHAGEGGNPEGAPRRDAKVIKGCACRSLAPDERRKSDHRHAEQHHPCRGLAGSEYGADSEDQRGHSDDGQHAAEMVHWIARFRDVRRYRPRHQEQREQCQRRGHQKRGTPPEELEQGTGRHRADHGRHRARTGPQSDRTGPPRPRGPQCRDQREGRGVRHPCGDPGHHATDDQRTDAGREGRCEADEDRQPQTEHQNLLAPVPVRDGTEVQHRHRQAEGAAQGHEVEAGLTGTERVPDLGQCDVCGREIDIAHKRRQDQSAQHQAGPAWHSPRIGCNDRRRSLGSHPSAACSCASTYGAGARPVSSSGMSLFTITMMVVSVW